MCPHSQNLSFFPISEMLDYFYCCSSTGVSIFPQPLPPAWPIPTSHSRSYSPLALSMCPLYMFLDDSSSFSHFIPSLVPSGYCQFVLYFNASGCILLAYWFCLLGSTYRWDHVVFVCHRLAYLLTICSLVPSMLLWKIGAPPFFLLHGIPSWKCTIVFWSTHLLWAHRLLPALAYCKLCCYAHWGA